MFFPVPEALVFPLECHLGPVVVAVAVEVTACQLGIWWASLKSLLNPTALFC